MEHKLIITPKTKILQLIETYPELEEILIGVTPAFKRLKNPLLRKTIAKVTTLQQAAAIGNVKVQDLVNRLRHEVGQDTISENEAGEVNIHYDCPEWFDPSKITRRFDIRAMLEDAEMPIHQVMADLKALPADEIYEITSPLLTVPLIEKASGLGLDHWVEQKNEDLFLIRFIKK
ncbi:protein of unknown function [Thermophagus xiamenensis]|uniref:DUF1858 domain-containing protein n=2 Tax=Thermophagus xiamenensis TaxID=385682 RepID=A0A1I1X2M9_9BACT|nr:protein of unknown function [Thermophagus xiamenensis]